MLPRFAGDLRRKRLVRLFELKTWREIHIILLDLCRFCWIFVDFEIIYLFITIHHLPSSILAYLDTNALVVETVWVARLGTEGVGLYIYMWKSCGYIYIYTVKPPRGSRNRLLMLRVVVR